MLLAIDEVKQIELKNRVITVGVFLIGIIICVSAILLHQPKITLDKDQLEILQSRRDALEKQNDALIKLTQEQSISTDFFAQRDSALQVEIKLNRYAIEKIKLPNEIYKRFNNYSSSDWTSYFSNLPDPGQ